MAVDTPWGESTMKDFPKCTRIKRAHKKTRNGCDTCKQRRVKCDEARPSCKRCEVRGRVCGYTASQQNLAIVPTCQLSSLKIADLEPGHAPDAFLWQYYFAHTSRALAAVESNESRAALWQSAVPAVAFGDIGTSHAIMALTALSINTNEKHSKDLSFDLEATAERHYCIALESLRTAIPDITALDRDTVLACSMVMIPCALARARRKQSYSTARRPDWIHHVRGYRSIGNTIEQSGWIDYPNPPMIPFLRGMEDISTSSPHANDDLGKSPDIVFERLYESMRCSRLEAIAKLRVKVANTQLFLSVADSEATLAAINKLERVMDIVFSYQNSKHFRVILDWLSDVPARFVDMMIFENDLARAIGAHWGALTLLLDNIWFMRGFAQFRIEKIRSLLQAGNSPYCDLMEWPISILEDWKTINMVKNKAGGWS